MLNVRNSAYPIKKGFSVAAKNAIVDYPLALQPFPFSEIMALKSEKNQDAYLILKLADRSYTAAQLQAKYGVPYDTNIFQSYSVFTYRVDNPRYGGSGFCKCLKERLLR